MQAINLSGTGGVDGQDEDEVMAGGSQDDGTDLNSSEMVKNGKKMQSSSGQLPSKMENDEDGVAMQDSTIDLKVQKNNVSSKILPATNNDLANEIITQTRYDRKGNLITTQIGRFLLTSQKKKTRSVTESTSDTGGP